MNATRRVMQGMRKRQHSGRQEAEKLEGEVDGAVGREGVGQSEGERGEYGEVIPSAPIYVSINSRTGVCLAPLSGWPVELVEGGGALHSSGRGRCPGP